MRKAFLEKAVVELVYKGREDLPLKKMSRSLKYDSIFVKSYYVHIIRTGDAKKHSLVSLARYKYGLFSVLPQ